MPKIDMMGPDQESDLAIILVRTSPKSTRAGQQQVLSPIVTELQQANTDHGKESNQRSPLRSAVHFFKCRFGHKQLATAPTDEVPASTSSGPISPRFSDVEASGTEAAELRQEAASIDPYSYIQTRTDIQSSAIGIFKDRQSWAVEVGLDGTGRLPPVDEDTGKMLSSSNLSSKFTSGPYTGSSQNITVAESTYSSFSLREESIFDRDECKTRVEMQRAALRLKSVHPQTLQDIAKDLDLRQNPEKGTSTMDFDLLLWTRFDKLVNDILVARHDEYQDRQEWWVDGNSTSQMFTEFLIPSAKRLQKQWQENLGASYTEIDRRRQQDMMGGVGAMRGISFNPGWKETGLMFTVNDSYRDHNRATGFGDQGFKPGQWWLNTWCAFRDGMLADPNKRATQVSSAVTALTLLRGVEKDGQEANTYEYTIEVRSGELMASLLGQRGRPVRLLRGYQLESRYAPQVGLRYDGLYGVHSYSPKLVEDKTNTHELKIVLRQLPNQSTMEKLSLVPTPEQVDDWKIFKNLLDAHFQAWHGDERETSKLKEDEAAQIDDTVWVRERAMPVLYKKDKKVRPSPHSYYTQ